MFLSFGFLAYVAIAIALVSSHVLTKTRIGLQLRAVGEDPATADAAGIDITRYKYVATCLGCIAGLGGLYYVMDYPTEYGRTMPLATVASSASGNVSILASTFGPLSLYFLHPHGYGPCYKMLPYVVTIVVLVITSVRNKRENQPPESLGLPYFREDR